MIYRLSDDFIKSHLSLKRTTHEELIPDFSYLYESVLEELGVIIKKGTLIDSTKIKISENIIEQYVALMTNSPIALGQEDAVYQLRHHQNRKLKDNQIEFQDGAIPSVDFDDYPYSRDYDIKKVLPQLVFQSLDDAENEALSRDEGEIFRATVDDQEALICCGYYAFPSVVENHIDALVQHLCDSFRKILPELSEHKQLFTEALMRDIRRRTEDVTDVIIYDVSMEDDDELPY